MLARQATGSLHKMSVSCFVLGAKFGSRAGTRRGEVTGTTLRTGNLTVNIGGSSNSDFTGLGGLT